MDYGVLTLVPILIVILIALTTRRPLEALMVGTLSTYIITDGFGFLHAWIEAFFSVATSRDNQWIFMVCALFGSLITLIGASRGTAGFSRHLEKICRGPRTTLLSTWILGILIFVDDYLNIMTLSTSMRKLTDQQKIPREALSYVIDSTGAPVCVPTGTLLRLPRQCIAFGTSPALSAEAYGNESPFSRLRVPFTLKTRENELSDFQARQKNRPPIRRAIHERPCKGKKFTLREFPQFQPQPLPQRPLHRRCVFLRRQPSR